MLDKKTLYSVSIKAVIYDSLQRVLLVKEHSDNWALPGGGIVHGETIRHALERELKEELGVDLIRSVQPLTVFMYYAPIKAVWRMWLVYDVRIDSYDLTRASDASEAAFVDVGTFKDSHIHSEQRIYEAILSRS